MTTSLCGLMVNVLETLSMFSLIIWVTFIKIDL